MRILARIEKFAPDRYQLDGRSFDSFLAARREMLRMIRARRLERTAAAASAPVAGGATFEAAGSGSN